MTAIDSLDSIFMLSAYTMPQRVVDAEHHDCQARVSIMMAPPSKRNWRQWLKGVRLVEKRPTVEEREEELRVAAERAKMLPQTDQDKLVNVSVVLTVVSILVALLISIVSRDWKQSGTPSFSGYADASRSSVRWSDRIHGVRGRSSAGLGSEPKEERTDSNVGFRTQFGAREVLVVL